MIVKNRHSAKDWGLLGLLALLFGGSFVFIEYAIETISPSTIVAARMWLAVGVLYILAKWRGHDVPPLLDARGNISTRWRYFAAIGIVGNLMPFTLVAWGQTAIESGLSGILVGTMPLMTLALAAAFVPGETLTGRKLAGFLCGFAGLTVLLGPAALGLVAEQSPVHQLAVLAGAFCYAANVVMTKRMPQTPVLGAATSICLCAAIAALPAALLLDHPWTLDPSLRSLAGVVFLALFPTALSAWVYISLVRAAGPTFMAQVNYLTPVCAVTLGALILGERPGPNVLAGLALILGGIAASQSGRSPESEKNRSTEIEDARTS